MNGACVRVLSISTNIFSQLTSVVKRPDLFEAVKASILDFNSTLPSQQPMSSLSNPQDLVIQFCENIFKVAAGITLQQVSVTTANIILQRKTYS